MGCGFRSYPHIEMDGCSKSIQTIVRVRGQRCFGTDRTLRQTPQAYVVPSRCNSTTNKANFGYSVPHPLEIGPLKQLGWTDLGVRSEQGVGPGLISVALEELWDVGPKDCGTTYSYNLRMAVSEGRLNQCRGFQAACEHDGWKRRGGEFPRHVLEEFVCFVRHFGE